MNQRRHKSNYMRFTFKDGTVKEYRWWNPKAWGLLVEAALSGMRRVK